MSSMSDPFGGATFQPTPSARRVTFAGCCPVVFIVLISTHTLRKEGDQLTSVIIRKGGDFNPHPPQGG